MTSDHKHTGKKPLPPVRELPQTETRRREISPHELAQSLTLAKAAVQAAAANRGQDILLLDLSEQTSMFDFFIIASGSSRRQLVAMSNEIDRVLKHEHGERRLSISGEEESRWIVLDYGSIVIHLFDEETRDFYNLESLWADGKQVDIADIVKSASVQMTRFAPPSADSE